MLVADKSPPFFRRLDFESEIEWQFLMKAQHYIDWNRVRVEPQAPLPTFLGRFLADFLLIVGDRRIVVECDGKDFHAGPRDLWRDAAIVGDRAADVIYRLRGKDLWMNITETVWAIFSLCPEVLQARHSAPQDFRRHHLTGDADAETVVFEIRVEESSFAPRGIEYIFIHQANVDLPGPWRDRYDFAKQSGAKTCAEADDAYCIDLRSRSFSNQREPEWER